MRKKIFIALGIVVVILVAVLLFKKSGSVDTSSGNAQGQPVTLSEKEVETIINMVGKHIKLPDEKPNVGVVTDIASLIQNEPFYQGAENGDVLLIYPSISRAILFDPEQDLIINVGPIVFENPEGGPVAPTE